MPQRDGDACRRTLAAAPEVGANRMNGTARTGQSKCPRMATLAKKRLQGRVDIGILYSPISRLEVVTNHPRCFSAIYGRKSMAKAKKSKPKKAKKSGRKPNAAFMKPMNTTSTLAAVIGSGAMPRTEVTKKLWAYIKRNGLQDKTNRRMINGDDKLRAVFGGKSQVSMFDMTKLVSKHLS